VLDVSERPVPAGVVGTPTYLLGEQVVWLGNPDLPDLLHLLDTAVGPDKHE
jgi:2-hydroxychromene-2-carboxylate isomerase